MTPQTIRTVLGTFYNFIRKMATSEDVTLVEEFNALPLELRQLIVNNAEETIAKDEADTKEEAKRKIEIIQEAYGRVLAAKVSPAGDPIATSFDDEATGDITATI